jgi:hypothetical protein
VLSDAGARFPEIGAHLLPAWELSSVRAGEAASGSRELAREHVARTEALLAGLRPAAAFPIRVGGRAGKAAAWTAAAWAAAAPALLAGAARPLRVLTPWRDARLDALVDVVPGDVRVAAGSSARLGARWRAAGAGGALALEVREPGGSWETAAAGPAPSFETRPLAAPLEYRAAFHALRGRTFTVTPTAPPRLRDATLRAVPPGRPAAAREFPLDGSSELALPRGSAVTVRGRPPSGAATAALEVSGMGRLPMRPVDGGLEASFVLAADASVSVRVAEPGSPADPAPAALLLRAQDDKPPVVELLSPAFEAQVSPRERLPVVFSAKDDNGVAAVFLHWRGPDGREGKAQARAWSASQREVLAQYDWDLSAWSAPARLEFWLEAVDDAAPRPNAALSARGSVRLLDLDAAHQRALRASDDAEASLRALARKEASLRAALGRPGDGAWRALEGELEADWPRALRAASEAASSAAADPYAAAGAAASARLASAELESLSASARPRARALSRAGDMAGAAAARAVLEAGARRAADELSQGREAQSMRELWNAAQRMGQASDDSAAALERAASGQALSSEERERLSGALRELERQAGALAQALSALPAADPGSLREAGRKVYTIPLEDALKASRGLQEALARGDYAAAARLAKELSGELARLREALSGAARDLGGKGALAEEERRLAELDSSWRDATREQAGALESAGRARAQAQAARGAALAGLLRELAQAQRAALRDAAVLGAAVPVAALERMRRAQDEFDAARVREAPAQLEDAVRILEAAKLRALAEKERAILRRLEAASAARPSSGGLDDARRTQERAGKTAGALAGAAGSLAGDGLLPEAALSALSRARARQEDAAGALELSDLDGASAAEAKALELLESGRAALSEAAKGRQAAREAVQSPFGAARSATSASPAGFVRLPGVQDYQPSQELRRELERSLGERRPKAFDAAVKEYLRELSP